ncbi:RILP-like protein 1 [Nibea albiflora]|uniref:RILP-like protein 1 n=1 Tax=Nibea albiflora TaxID=240163 RepID=A0ACB7FCQ1_NIBAL|nr:RILP-like protein 1 [Nibea albiflora]
METSVMSALDRPAAELTAVDVYDIAAVLGQEFERIIDRFGCESLVGVVPKVVRVLELLEALVSRGAARQEAEELRRELDRLRQERSDRYKQERKHQKELELVEDVWRGEIQDLLSQIAQLQAENKKLLVSLPLKESPATEEDLQKQEGLSEKERQVMKKLQELVDKQRDEIRAKDHELTLKNEDVEALQMQQHRLIRINQDLRHRIGVTESQGKALIQQRAELEAASQVHQQELGASADRGHEAEKGAPGKASTDGEPEEEADSLEEESDKPRFTLQELRDVLQERNELKAQVFVLQEELAYYKSDEFEEFEDVSSVFCTSSPPTCTSSTDQPESGIRRLIFTAIMPMVAAGLIVDDPTLLPIRRLVSFV